MALLRRHEHGIPKHPHGLAIRHVPRRARPGQVPNHASRSRPLSVSPPAATHDFRPDHAPFGRPRGAHTARSDRPCGTTTDGPEPVLPITCVSLWKPMRTPDVAAVHDSSVTTHGY